MNPAPPARIALLGSLAMDLLVSVDALPRPGESVEALRLRIERGGKGGNQAVAAVRQGVEVLFLGALGRDEAGRSYRKFLKEEGIDVTAVRSVGDPTGTTIITSEPGGGTTTLHALGANERLDDYEIRKHDSLLQSCDLVLTQLEMPYEAILEAGRIANAASIPLVINASPPDPEFPWQEIRTDCLVVNETEAAALFGTPPRAETPSFVRQAIHEMRVENLVVTRGDASTLVYTREGEHYEVEAMPAIPTDPYGAGDAFVGCLAARLAGKEPLENAVRAANCAGALATLGCGAQAPIPDRAAVEQHLVHLPRQLSGG